MCATRAVLVLLFAVVACAVAIPAAVPQPASPGAPVGIAQRGPLEKRQIDGLETGAATEQGQDLKGSSSYGYGFYGGYPYYGGYGYGGYRPYWGGYGYPFGGYGGYPYYYQRSYYPYRSYAPFYPGYGGYGYYY